MVKLLPKPYASFIIWIAMINCADAEQQKRANAVYPGGGSFGLRVCHVEQHENCRDNQQGRYRMRKEINRFPDGPHLKLLFRFVRLPRFFADLIEDLIHTLYILAGIINEKVKLRDYSRLILDSTAKLIADLAGMRFYGIDGQIFIGGIKKTEVYTR